MSSIRTCLLVQEAVLDLKEIRVSYLRTWFIPDVIAAFPIGYILLFAVILILKQETVHTDIDVCIQSNENDTTQ